MAISRNVDGRKVSGKYSKKSNEIHRVRNGREQVYTTDYDFNAPPSAAQKLQRSVFGKTNAIVNAIMNDPQQQQEWRQRMEEYNRSINPFRPPYPKKFITVRQFAYSVISQQLANQPAARRRRAKLPVPLPRGVTVQIKPFADLSAADLYEILKARFRVFYLEQQIRYLDLDNVDYIATHCSIRRRGLVLAYARLFPDAEPGVLRVGRMLTTQRDKGYGRHLMSILIAEARRQGATTLRLHAQTQAAPFYTHLGFQPATLPDGIPAAPFTEADLPHVCMEMSL